MSAPPRFQSLVLAGIRESGDAVAASGGKSCKAFVDVAGRPMVLRVVEALEQSGCVGEIAICIDPDVQISAPEVAAAIESRRLLRLDSRPTPSQSVLQALEGLAPETPLLVTTADHPLLTAAMVSDFVAAAHASGADVAVGLTPIRLLDEAYPQTRRTRLKFREDSYAGCNLFALMGPDARRAVAFWGRMEARRKQPWRLALALGPLTLTAYVSGLLSLEGALTRLGRRAGARLHAVVLGHTEAAIDVDTVEDLQLAEQILRVRSGIKIS